MSPAVRMLAGAPAHAALLQGVDRMTRLLRPTLGPLPRTVAVGRLTGISQGPEVLDSGAVIARRTLQLADPFEDMGGMLIRHLAWRVFERVGDGTTTAAVLAQALMHAGLRYVAAGGNPVSLKSGMQRGLEIALAELRRQSRTIDGPVELTCVVRGNLGGPSDLAEMLGEVIDAVGPDGGVLVEDAQGTRTTHEYIDGIRWNAGYASSFLLRADEATTARVMNPRVMVTDYVLEHVEQVVPALEACVGAGQRSLFIVATEVRDAVVGLLVANRDRGVLDNVMVVKAPSFGAQRTRILEDIAAVTGGRCVSQERHDRLADVTLDDLGSARQAWATQYAFGILGGQGNKAHIRHRIAEAKVELSQVAVDDEYTSNLIRERIGKLAGTAAVVRVGAHSVAEREVLKLRIEAAVRSARSALIDGVVPGGGAALVQCARALETLDATGDECVGLHALAQALLEPMRVIAANAGFDPPPILARARATRQVFDVVRREWVDPWTVGIIDPLAVTQTALETSVSAAVTALTADVLIHRTDAPTAVQP